MAYALAIPIASAATAQTVMIYGDSLSAAYGLDPNDGWVSLLQVRLKPEGIIVVNSSISGETTHGGLSRISTDLAKIKPNVVVLALGANDGLRGLPIADTKKNLQSMIDSIQKAKARIVLIGIQIPPNYGIDYSRQFRDLYFELAKSNRVLPPPFLLEGVADKLELFQADRLHPKAEAQPAILENVLPTIRKVLNKTASATKADAKP
ncbi:MAG: arylesterase [Betaproteobacteria bacterium]|nr:arylesterase [Betaproteobacteria bacterium]